MKNMKKVFLMPFFLFFLFIGITNTQAASANINLNGNGTIENNKTFTLDIYASNINGSLMSTGGKITSSNSSCVSLVSLNAVAGVTNGSMFAYSNASGVTGSAKLGTATFKTANEPCQATITFGELKVAFTDGTKLTPGAVSKTIKVVKYSTNNNLKSLSVSSGSLSPSFSAGTTSYSVNVGEDTSSININAEAEDGTAKVSGTGNKSLKYGSNKFTISVKAENGATKNYTINVNREDNRSSDANLKSLTVKNGTLSPSFSAGTTSYTIEVPYSVSKLDINAEAADSTSKVNISNPELVAESTTTVTVRVVAQNGASKTYTIKVKRGKDPNKKLNNDNNLVSLKPSIGMISPAFASDKTNYFIYLPYEVDSITFDYEVSDKEYASVEKKGEDKLKPDSANKIVFAVKAEDGSIKNYTVTVYRAKNPEELDASLNIDSPSTLRLKSLTLDNGKLTSTFDSEKMTYTYSKKDGFSYKYELVDESAYVSTYETEGSIYIVLESESGDMVVYCLHEQEKDNLKLILIIIIIILTILSLYLLVDKFILSKNKVPKEDKKEEKTKEKNIKSKK